MRAVIMAGGSGTRLWPLSRRNQPKQLQALISKKTMLQETIERLDFLPKDHIYVSTNEKYADIVKEQCKKYIPLHNIIIEPDLRDTAPSIGLSAAYLAKDDPEAVMSIIYADHLIQEKTELKKKLMVGAQLAQEENTLNIIEVKAKYPNVNLGYVKIGKMLKEVDGTEIYAFEKFTEKPDLKTAELFLKSHKYLWNTGLYIWKVDTILKKFQKHLPNTYEHLKKIQEKLGTSEEQAALKKHYPLCDKISIDYSIMEKIDPEEVRIIPAELGWSDVGTWESIYEELASTKNSNVIKGKHLGIDTKGSLIYGTGKKLITTIGVENLIIVETEDSVLICNKNRSQDVKKLVEKMNESSYKNLL